MEYYDQYTIDFLYYLFLEYFLMYQCYVPNN